MLPTNTRVTAGAGVAAIAPAAGATIAPTLSGKEDALGEEGQPVGVQPGTRLTTLPPLEADKTHGPFPTSATLGQRGVVKTPEQSQQQNGEEERGRVSRWKQRGDGRAEDGGKLGNMTAKVGTHRSPGRKLPGYLSASPDGFGAASRWGALSKAHLEYHRLNTAGDKGEGGGWCLSLQRWWLLLLLFFMLPISLFLLQKAFQYTPFAIPPNFVNLQIDEASVSDDFTKFVDF